jgi:lipoteichoic acid synthase
MIQSIVSINAGSSFFTADLPDELRNFDPTTSINMVDPILLPENHTVKNIVFVILESAGAIYFDGYGGNFNLSPNLNHYSTQALTIETAYAHAPATNRSLVSLLGSIYPYISYKSLTQENPQLDHPTLSSVLKKEGYRTSFFSSANLNFQNCLEFLSYRDFDQIRDFSMIDCSEKFNLDSEDYTEGDGIDDMCLVSTLTSWLDEDTSKNFFSMIWTVQGHYPYYFAGVEEDFGVADFNFNRYLNALKHNDKLVGKLMKELELRGLDKNTLVVVVGDHGEAFGQHGQYGHGTALYDENIRVPLYFINGTLFKGQRKNDIAGLKDIAATSLSVVGVEIPDEWQGRDLLRTNSEETFFFAPWSDYLFGYRKGNMKFIFNESLKQVEVFDLHRDRDEKINLINGDIQPEIDYARKRVAAWVQFQDAYLKQKMVEKR